ncbi:hypothetical protein Tco_1432395, partial [Tanacetum coccineum]
MDLPYTSIRSGLSYFGDGGSEMSGGDDDINNDGGDKDGNDDGGDRDWDG